MPKQEPDASVARLQVVDDAAAPLIYADGCLGGGPSGPNMMLTFAVRAVDHKNDPPSAYLLTNLRLVLPVEAAKGLADFINSVLIPVEPAADNADGHSIQ